MGPFPQWVLLNSVRMDETVFVILLLTGFCVASSSFPNVFYFVKEGKTWYDAQNYCILKHTELAQIHNQENLTTMMNAPTGNYTGKAWIGLYENTSEWTWVDGQPATYFSWEAGRPDSGSADELCVLMIKSGSWNNASCSEAKPSVCFDGHSYYLVETEMTWNDARSNCEMENSTLAKISDEGTNSKVRTTLSTYTVAWIGLSKTSLWFWSETRENYTFTNWQHGQPDNLNGEEWCAAVEVKNGTWTDEQCNVTLPFFCYGIPKTWTMLVKMKIQSRANMEDPTCSAGLQQQLHAAFANQDMTDFKLTWTKTPVKRRQKSSDNLKSEMDCYVTLILLLFGCSLNCCSQFPPRKYYYINQSLNWTDAQHYCREKYTDLATIENMDDISMLKPTFSFSWGWIGLRDDPKSWKKVMNHDANSWRWSATGETSKTGYQAWQTAEPDNAVGDEDCVIMAYDGTWHDISCGSESSFVCYTESNQSQKIYTYVSTIASWKYAQDYCREHHTDLAMIENMAENTEVFNVKPSDSRVSIGLYRTSWTWSDKSNSTFRNWISNGLNNYAGSQHCATENNLHEWGDESCSAKRSFVCHKASKLKTVVRMKTETDADMTDPAIHAQVLQKLGALLTAQGWTDFTLQWKILPRKQDKN
ncbi:macrophage mannose receptor 1-like [Toxotes jaculatrix]|uniref:macrophage mannose receptor 1-like n=1 Tax=Toxotes jaculatrix TaxID=941984 RepID=UPI001B3B0C13|nr:macrophage mannose receptor 1-like [Toxotes jaculatrix]